MGLFEWLFGNRARIREADGVFQTLTAYQPQFTTRREEIYESGLVRSAIHAKANHISKLEVEIRGSAKPTMQTALKQGPNAWQSWGQFLYRTSTILDVQTTAFIVPVMDEYDRECGVFTVLPSRCEIVRYGDTPYLRYEFSNGKHAAMELARCGILTKYQYKDDFFGAGNGALQQTMDLISIQNQGIAEGVKSAATYRFMAKLKNFASPEDLAEERKRFTENNLKTGGGVLIFPNSYDEIKQIESKPFVADSASMELIQKNVYNYFGVNEDVLQNKAYGDAWSAFYEGAIEPFSIQLSDVLTRMLYTKDERSRSNYIMLTSNRLQYMSANDKLNVSSAMADRGIMTRNEIRTIWNLPLLPPEIGDKLPVRGEYYILGESRE